MKCKEIEPLIYMYKAGELTKYEQNLLEEHLAICNDCRILKEEINQQDFTLKELISENENLAQSAIYKEQIIEQINILKHESQKEASNSKTRMVHYLSNPVYRYLSAAVITGLVMSFLLQNYSTYINLSQLELKFGNPSTYEAVAESKAIVFGDDDLSYIRASTQIRIKPGRAHTEFTWLKGNRFLLMSIRKHRYLQELANHNPGIDRNNIITIFNNSLYLGESRRNYN